MLEMLLKSLGGKALLPILAIVLMKVGNWFKNKDADNVGSDDAMGNVLVALSQAFDAFEDGNQTAFRKGLELAYTTLGIYLGKK